MKPVQTPIPSRALLPIVPKYLLTFFLVSLAAGCTKGTDTPEPGKTKLKVAYIGLTCEAPIFVAYEKGFYAEEGLDVELVKTDWDGLREGLGLGRFDANHTLIMYLLKPIEQGLDVKITGGVHTGCLRLQVGVKSDIKTVKDVKGKKIGVPIHLGCPPQLFASRVLAANGIDPNPEKKEITWVTFAQDVLGKAVEDGRVDAIATSDPIGTILVGMGVVRTIADQAEDPPYRDEYCCVSVVSGKLARDNPAAAGKATRALFKAAKWVEENSTAAAKLAVEKKYIAASPELNAQALVKLRYVPGVAKCRQSIDQVAKEMVNAGLLSSSTDPEKLAKRAWLDLDGVTDEWIKSLKVDRVQGGGRPAQLNPVAFAAIWDGRCLCCARGCCLE
jgi:NitT/TauT family transport system substrate-binding protein